MRKSGRKPRRSPEQAQTSISLPQSILDECTRRAQSLGMTRSQYMVQLIRVDLIQRGALRIPDTTTGAQGAHSHP